MKKKSEFDVLVIFIVAMVILLPLGMLVRAWMLTKLWVMFIIPQFQLSELSYSSALGLSLIISVLTKQDLSKLQEKESKDLWVEIGNSFGRTLLDPIIVVGFAYLIVWLFN